MKRGKKAQVSVFIIIAIVLLGVIVGIFFLIKNNMNARIDNEYFSSANIRPDVEKIQSSIIDCSEETSEQALEVIGLQGGYYSEPSRYSETNFGFIPYYYYNGDIIFPSLSEVENQLSLYVDSNLGRCLNELSFDNYEIDYSNVKTISEITKNEEVLFTINSEIDIIRDGKRTVFELGKEQISQKSILYEISEIAEYITNSHRDNPDMMCVNCIADMARERDLYVDFLEYDRDIDTLVVISENKTRTNPYIFEFLNKYPEEN